MSSAKKDMFGDYLVPKQNYIMIIDGEGFHLGSVILYLRDLEKGGRRYFEFLSLPQIKTLNEQVVKRLYITAYGKQANFLPISQELFKEYLTKVK